MHRTDVFLYLLFIEFRNGNLSQVDYKEPFDSVPVLNVSFPLSDTLQDMLLLFGLAALRLEHTLYVKLALA